MVYKRLKKRYSIELLSSLFDVPWNVQYWRSMKSITLNINGQIFEYEITVQALKDTCWMKPRYFAIFFVLKVSNNHCSLLIEGFCFAWLFEKKSGISYSWVNEKWIMQKMNLLLTVYFWNWTMCAHYIKRDGYV